MNNNEGLEKLIDGFSSGNGLVTGICRFSPECLNKGFYDHETFFISGNEKKRGCFDTGTANLEMAEARSVIVMGWPAFGPLPPDMPDNIIKPEKPAGKTQPNHFRGVISLGADETDYHMVLRLWLERLMETLGKRACFKYRIFVDQNPFSERSAALKAGLGFIGKNTSLILPGKGSFFYLGTAVTDLRLKPNDIYSGAGCGDCRLCVEACPGKALWDGRVFCDYKRCVSYLTQKKGCLSKEEMKIMGTRIYGCDACLKACPHHKPWPGETKGFDLEEILSMTKSGFRRGLKNTAAGWRGLSLLKRNALIALCNSGGPGAGELIRTKLNDKNEMIRKTAEKALEILERR